MLIGIGKSANSYTYEQVKTLTDCLRCAVRGSLALPLSKAFRRKNDVKGVVAFLDRSDVAQRLRL